jgi:DeoR family transcriptional regulator of aga operon
MSRAAGMPQHQRYNRILEILAAEGQVDVDDVAERLGVSTATVRRDLGDLADQQLLARTHGGAVPSASSYDLPLRYKSARQASEKQRIGAAAAALVEPGQVVGMNGGSTCMEVARALALRSDLIPVGGGGGVTVLTNAMNLASELLARPQIDLVLTGGAARRQSFELIGPMAEASLEGVLLDMTFLGVDGVDAALGACGHHVGEASVNRRMAAAAGRVVIVADATKLGRRAFARICPASEIDVLVTNEEAPPEALAPFREVGIEVIAV